MSIRLVAAGSDVELRRVPLNWVLVNVAHVVDLQLYAKTAYSEITLACDQAGWLHLSTNGGTSYTPVPTSVQSGVSCGSFSAGQRKDVKLKLLIPPGTQVRRRAIALLLGEGV